MFCKEGINSKWAQRALVESLKKGRQRAFSEGKKEGIFGEKKRAF